VGVRLSLTKAAHVAMSSAAWQEIRVRSGRDDNSVWEGTQRFQGTFLSSRPKWSWARGPPKVVKNPFSPAVTFHGNVTLPFVIPRRRLACVKLREE
jgi:hypothetical protein